MVNIRQTGLLKFNFEKIPKNAFSGFCQKFPQVTDEVKNFVCQFPNPWALRVSGMGCYTSKCENKSKSLHPTVHPPHPPPNKPLSGRGVGGFQTFTLASGNQISCTDNSKRRGGLACMMHKRSLNISNPVRAPPPIFQSDPSLAGYTNIPVYYIV
jgi:hypothetical protein